MLTLRLLGVAVKTPNILANRVSMNSFPIHMNCIIGHPLKFSSPSGIGVWRSMIFRGQFRTGSHYDNKTMVNAVNPDLPKDPVLADAACRIFGTSPTSNPHARSVRKLLMKPLIGEAIQSYYPEYLVHNKYGYTDPLRVRAQEKLERLKRRGKGPPKKGQGKRALKKK